MSWTSRILALIIGLALLAGIWSALRPQPVDVDVAEVVRAPLTLNVVNDGVARVRERYTVSAPVAGTLARIELHEGDVIEPGSVLARLLPLPSPLLDPEARKAAELRLASASDTFEQANVTVTRARVARDEAKADLERVRALAQHGAVASAQLDQASADSRMRDAELASAEFTAKVAEHDIAQARAALARFTPGAAKSEQFEITSPVHGQVLHILHKSEGVVSPGTALLEIGDPRALELVADVLSQDAVKIKRDAVARVLHWGGDDALSARVRRVEPAAFTKVSALGVDEQRVNVVLDLEGPDEAWRALGDGFGVEIEIAIWSEPDVVQVPTSALFRQGAGYCVFVIVGDRARQTPVETGHRGPLQAEIVRGVRPGEQVIEHPASAIKDGVRVSHR